MVIPPTPDASAEETTVVKITVYGPQLDEDKISKLIRASADGITLSTPEITTIWNGARLRSRSLSGLRTATENRLEPGDPRQLENLQIRAGDDRHKVAVDIDAQSAVITIESADSAWAIGRGEQFRKILRYADGSPELRRWCTARLSGASLLTSTMIVVLLATAGVVDGRPSSVATAALTVIVSTIVGFLIGRYRERGNQTVLWIDGPIPGHGWTTWTVGERAAVLALLVTSCSLVANILR
ncbi:hypothetical protein L3i22_033320 [Actinoplanes sp. L3-i22]|nr:hypothetical protein L3i22_033320 [Actinoplanes sp. L3-i22]